MDSYLKQKVEELVKSMKSKVVEHKDAIEDLVDPNRIAEMGANSVATNRTSAVLQRNEDEEECKCKGEKDCECDKTDDEMEKAEKFVKSIMDSFKEISSAYLKKMEMEKAKVDQFERTPKAKKRARKERGNPTTEEERQNPKAFKPHRKTAKPKQFVDPETGDVQQTKQATDFKSHPDRKEKLKKLKEKLRNKQYERQNKELEEEHGEKFSDEKMAASEIEKKEGKPFHGYNKNKHSVKGGLSKKGREKINRETGSNLKAPVSSKAAKKSPKKAARRKSFCARMSGVKGPTSKKGKLTPKGAALKRWDC